MALKVEMQDAILLNTVNTEVLVCIIWTVWLKNGSWNTTWSSWLTSTHSGKARMVQWPLGATRISEKCTGPSISGKHRQRSGPLHCPALRYRNTSSFLGVELLNEPSTQVDVASIWKNITTRRDPQYGQRLHPGHFTYSLRPKCGNHQQMGKFYVDPGLHERVAWLAQISY